MNCRFTISHIDISFCECNLQYAVELFELNETERSQRQEADALLQTQVEELKEALTAQIAAERADRDAQIAAEKADREALEAALRVQNGQLHANKFNINNPKYV